MSKEFLDGNKIRILDFDGSLLRQNRLLNHFSKQPFSSQIIDFRDLSSSCRYLVTKSNIAKIKKRLQNTSRNAITLYGSGDFHHVSSILISEFKKPISVVVFDYHPDWDGMSPFVSCGSWIAEICKWQDVKKIILLGPSSDDMSTAVFPTAAIRALRSGKLEIFPYEKKTSKIYFQYLKDSKSFSSKCNLLGSTLFWNNLKQRNNNFIGEIISGLPTEDVYISIDKDCLLRQHAVTNWEEGVLPLEWLLSVLSIIKKDRNIVGLDISGEYSSIAIKNPLKKLLSSLDHPKQGANFSELIPINEETNIKILELLNKTQI